MSEIIQVNEKLKKNIVFKLHLAFELGIWSYTT